MDLSVGRTIEDELILKKFRAKPHRPLRRSRGKTTLVNYIKQQVTEDGTAVAG